MQILTRLNDRGIRWKWLLCYLWFWSEIFHPTCWSIKTDWKYVKTILKNSEQDGRRL